jgi:hypothetical protein
MLVGCGSGGGGGSTSSNAGVPTNSAPAGTSTSNPTLPMFVVPSIANTVPGGTIVLSARNAVGTANFTVSTNNSGAYISASGGYIAGKEIHVTDVVTITDSNGQTVQVPILVAPAVVFAPSAAVVTINSSTSLNASGGSGTGYQYGELANASAGAVTNGIYQAGPNPNKIDVVTVQDSLGSVNFGLFAVSPSISMTVPGGSPNTFPGGTLQLGGTGGSGEYRYYLANNLSGGTVNEVTGLYTAGTTGDVIDVILIGDTSSPAFFSVAQITVAAGP